MARTAHSKACEFVNTLHGWAAKVMSRCRTGRRRKFTIGKLRSNHTTQTPPQSALNHTLMFTWRRTSLQRKTIFFQQRRRCVVRSLAVPIGRHCSCLCSHTWAARCSSIDQFFTAVVGGLRRVGDLDMSHRGTGGGSVEHDAPTSLWQSDTGELTVTILRVVCGSYVAPHRTLLAPSASSSHHHDMSLDFGSQEF